MPDYTFISKLAIQLLKYFDSAYINLIAEILHILIVERASFSRQHYSELLFLPDHDVFKVINAKLEEGTVELTLTRRLQKITNCCATENLDLKLSALLQLKKLIDVNYGNMVRLFQSEEALLNKLVTALIGSCAASNEEIKLMATEALGELISMEPNAAFIQPIDTIVEDYTDEKLVQNVITSLRSRHSSTKQSAQMKNLDFMIQNLLEFVRSKYKPEKQDELMTKYIQDHFQPSEAATLSTYNKDVQYTSHAQRNTSCLVFDFAKTEYQEWLKFISKLMYDICETNTRFLLNAMRFLPDWDFQICMFA